MELIDVHRARDRAATKACRRLARASNSRLMRNETVNAIEQFCSFAHSESLRAQFDRDAGRRVELTERNVAPNRDARALLTKVTT